MYIYVALLIGWMRCASHAVSYQLIVTLTISGTTENAMRGPHRGASLISAAWSFQHRPSSAPKILTFSLACEENPKQTSTWRRLGPERQRRWGAKAAEAWDR
ncbi:unnamed protein product [Musa acuminata var. zebrina]